MKKDFHVFTILALSVFAIILIFASCNSKDSKKLSAVYIPVSLDPELPAIDTLLTQTEADIYSWQSFIALNWTANQST